MKDGRASGGSALRLDVYVDEGHEADVFVAKKKKVSLPAVVRPAYMNPGEKLTERKLSLAIYMEGVRERRAGSQTWSAGSGVKEWLNGLEWEYEMLDLSSEGSEGSVSDDGWAVVPAA
jgi:hypothetical protein